MQTSGSILESKLLTAVGLHKQGNVEQAEAMYREILEVQPKHFDALHYLGLAAFQQGQMQKGVELISQAIAIDGNQVPALCNLAMGLQQLNRHDDAIAYYKRALQVEPKSVELHYRLSHALLDLQRYEEAVAVCDQALTYQANAVDLLQNRGTAMLGLRRIDEALTNFDQVLAFNPSHAQALCNLAMGLQQLNRHDDAIAYYKRALQVEPKSVELHYRLSHALLSMQRYEEAVVVCDQALSYQANAVDLLQNRGTAMLGLRRIDEALTNFDQVLAFNPSHAQAHNNRGVALVALSKHLEALSCFERALTLQPNFVDALSNRGGALVALKKNEEALASCELAVRLEPDFKKAIKNCGIALSNMRRFDEARQAYLNLLRVAPDDDYALGSLFACQLHCCDWTQYDDIKDRVVEAVRRKKKACSPFTFLNASEFLNDQRLCAQTYIEDLYPASCTPLWKGERYRHDKIRVAYLSADFHNHATAYLMARMFEAHDKRRFDITAISFGPNVEDDMRRRLRGAFDRFIDVREQSDLQVAQLMRELEIDITVELKGFTADNRAGIFAHRPAPIQVNYLGYPGTLGADYIDYILADKYVIPESDQKHYSEKVVYLPDTYQVTDSKRVIAEHLPTRAQVGLPVSGFVFCSFNNNYKITPEIFDVWMRLLQKVPGSVLWLLEGNPTVAANLKREAQARGVAAERLVFAPRMPQAEHLARQKLADLFLDTLPVNAHTTTSDALWAGLPVLTCMGKAFAGRVAGSLLHAIGLPELVTDTLEQYEALALQLATTPQMLVEIKVKLEKNRSTFPLFDTDRFCRHVESAYQAMWDRYQRGEAPASFSVQPTAQLIHAKKSSILSNVLVKFRLRLATQ